MEKVRLGRTNLYITRLGWGGIPVQRGSQDEAVSVIRAGVEMGGGGAYEGLLRMRDEGRIDFIGITSHNLDVLERAVEEGHFDVIMACYSFLEPDAERKLFPLTRAKDIGMISMKPFSGGVIEDPGPALRFVLTQ